MGKGGHGGGAVGGGHSHNEEYPDDNWNRTSTSTARKL